MKMGFNQTTHANNDCATALMNAIEKQICTIIMEDPHYQHCQVEKKPSVSVLAQPPAQTTRRN